MTTKSTSHARKMLMDFMDTNRPWATCPDVYTAMEEIADYAAYAFVGEVRPKQDHIKRLEGDLLKLTQSLKEHPEGFDGPCACEQCRIDAAD